MALFSSRTIFVLKPLQLRDALLRCAEGVWSISVEMASPCFQSCVLGVIVFECGFAAIWFVPRPVAISFLICGAAFHLSVALLMGLNVFLWAFLSTYPAIWHCCVNPGPRALL